MSVRIGVIGCGKIAQVRHLPEYQANPEAEIYGLYDVNLERAKELAQKYQCRWYQTCEELLADPQIDAVSVCVANVAHAQISIAAMRAGKHVLCEKPMAVTPEQCEEMVKTAQETGRYLMIGHNQRLFRVHQKAKTLLEQGVIGRVLTFRTTFGHGGPEGWSIDPGKNTWFFDKSRAFMGVMADLGIHKTDLIQYLLDDQVIETQAVLTTLDKTDAAGQKIGVDDNAICIYRMRKGTIGTMTASWTYYGPEDNSTLLYGTNGRMRIGADPDHAILIETTDGDRVSYKIEENPHNSGVIDLFVKCLVDQQPPVISGDSVLHAMKVVFASIESSHRGERVTIE